MKRMIGVGIFLFLVLSFGMGVSANQEDDILEEDGDIAAAKIYLKDNQGNFQVSEFTVTHYSPLDSALPRDYDSVKRLGPNVYSPVQWYRENGKWVFSAATKKRMNKVRKGFNTEYRGTLESRTFEVDGNEETKVYEVVFPKGASLSQGDRKKYVPLGCAGDGMNYSGSPWSGSSGKIPKTGMVAADRNVLPEGTDLYISGYGKGKVLDVGGAIKGKRLDLTVNDCELALSKGKVEGVPVAFDKGKAKISGSSLTNKDIENFIAAGVHADGVDYSEERQKQVEMANSEKGYVSTYQEYFEVGESQIDNIGVNDRTSRDSKVGEFLFESWLTKVASFINSVAMGFSILLIGAISILWMMAFLAYAGIDMVNEWLHKITVKRVDVGVDGFATLWNMTYMLLLISVIVVTGLLPRIVALIYDTIAKFLEWITLFM